MVKNIVKAIVVVAAMVGMVGVLQTQKADATVTVVDKVAFCHRDSNVKQPYGPKKIETSVNALFQAGHDDHNGPVYNGTNQNSWGDIIPPFWYMTSGRNSHLEHYDGKNWDAAGQAIWNNDCQFAPTGVSSYLLACEKITLNTPTGVKPAGSSYQYYIDGVPATGTKVVLPGSHTITLKVNGVVVDTDVVNVEKCKEEKPEGKSNYKLYCEAIKLMTPSSVEPEHASYQYYIDGVAAAVGTHTVTAGSHTITLKVNDSLVDTDVVNVEKCEGEQKPADVTVTLACDKVTNVFTFTITNSGEASAEVMFNAETFTLKGGSTVTRTLNAGQALTVKVDGKVYVTEGGESYDGKVFVSCQGQGSVGGGTTTVLGGGQGAATGVTSLPYTGSAAAQIASLVTLIASVGTAVGGYVWRNRVASSL